MSGGWQSCLAGPGAGPGGVPGIYNGVLVARVLAELAPARREALLEAGRLWSEPIDEASPRAGITTSMSGTTSLLAASFTT